MQHLLEWEDFQLNENYVYTDEFIQKDGTKVFFIKYYKEPGVTTFVKAWQRYLEKGKEIPENFVLAKGHNIENDSFTFIQRKGDRDIKVRREERDDNGQKALIYYISRV